MKSVLNKFSFIVVSIFLFLLTFLGLFYTTISPVDAAEDQPDFSTYKEAVVESGVDLDNAWLLFENPGNSYQAIINFRCFDIEFDFGKDHIVLLVETGESFSLNANSVQQDQDVYLYLSLDQIKANALESSITLPEDSDLVVRSINKDISCFVAPISEDNKEPQEDVKESSFSFRTVFTVISSLTFAVGVVYLGFYLFGNNSKSKKSNRRKS